MTLTPAEETALETDRLPLCDTEEIEQAEFLAQNDKYRCRLRADARLGGDVFLWVDEYVSLGGLGYLETCESIVRGTTFRHIENHGPATHFEEHGWREYKALGDDSEMID